MFASLLDALNYRTNCRSCNANLKIEGGSNSFSKNNIVSIELDYNSILSGFHSSFDGEDFYYDDDYYDYYDYEEENAEDMVISYPKNNEIQEITINLINGNIQFKYEPSLPFKNRKVEIEKSCKKCYGYNYSFNMIYNDSYLLDGKEPECEIAKEEQVIDDIHFSYNHLKENFTIKSNNDSFINKVYPFTFDYNQESFEKKVSKIFMFL